ncbi:hypothetical protein [Roseospirillum parvum]|uniref:Uncharacterized protein n=1 Tax=Roseospirillum parvum TaxID=83401 RepID=A0A1G7WI18_9PROT|nr:hypothetical protein [Roseospirillum parvum]SDG71586.1 hypothetical protein SAMN05421742_102206 [Roseospirillum parvum]
MMGSLRRTTDSGIRRIGRAGRAAALACALWLGATPALLPGANPALGADSFLKGFDDLPLPAGFSALDDPPPTVFDSAYGRLAEAYARGPGPAAKARAFYADTLPQLGWTALPGDPLGFQRGNERLRLDFTSQGGSLLIHFSLKPN